MKTKLANLRKANGMNLVGAGACVVVASLLVAACVGDAAPPADLPAASASPDGQAPVPAKDAAVPPADAGDELEGGGLLPIDPDAGLDTDAGIDAGPACGTVVPGRYATTTCSSRAIIMAGGALTTATYQLEAVTVLGSVAFCGADFTAYEHRGGLKVTATSDTEATFELFDLYRKPSLPPVTPTSHRYDAKVVANGNQLTLSPSACAQKPAPSTAAYSATTTSGKKSLLLRLPYGSGSALYRFVEP